MKRSLFLLPLLLFVFSGLSGCTPPVTNEASADEAIVDSFDSCAAAGYPITRSYPPGCHTPDGRVFYRQNGRDPFPLKPAETKSSIKTFEDCVAAGNAVLKSYPPKCIADGNVYVKEVTPRPETKRCKDNCGNGRCEEMVCMAIGCPCAETAASCPEDCSP